MAIRQNTNPHHLELHPELQDILMRNGMRATVTGSSNGFQLVVQGHDSPLLYYPISEKQLRALVDWGTNTANKRAYNTLASIVAADFDLPRDFVHARNANGRVAMGLHGNRIGVGEYGRVAMPVPMMHRHPFGRGFLGWTPRNQEGWHMRWIGGQLWFPAGAPMVAVRPDGRQKPGELQTGGYGFYYKGTPQGAIQGTVPQQDVLAQMQTVIHPIPQPERPKTPAVPYNQAITSDVYFSNEKWQEVLKTHGIVIDPEKKTVTIQSSAEQADFVYDLTDEEVAKLTNNSIKEVPVADRIRILNGVIQDDFADAITLDTLNKDKMLEIALKPEIRQELNQQEQSVANLAQNQPTGRNEQYTITNEEQAMMDMLHEGHPEIGAVINGRDLYELDGNKAWFREGKHGREVSVERISVQPVTPESRPEGEQKGKDKGASEMKYSMTAVINGEVITHEISQKDYNKFLAVNDLQRMKMFSKIFSEVDMKDIQSTDNGAKIGAGILTALTVGAVVLGAASRPRPEFYGGCHGPRPYFKPGVDTPEDVAARNFDAIINQPRPQEPHRGQGF